MLGLRKTKKFFNQALLSKGLTYGSLFKWEVLGRSDALVAISFILPIMYRRVAVYIDSQSDLSLAFGIILLPSW